ncbi:hypothetical protein HBI56_122410 [Parastagonospora nodorum]|uniref:Uncharacterized protein n=1 Tax=Phaeosphaeria nodorum (strain SN15 / ATCC MYA-4574 / FGSC 10173) TaxID=321614 RepID=A0A7U2I6W7_PHANO|nr:hypothetical protein HBH56_052280 [Parastagonospora nodorum]QRD02167.1 hypothetical protein JI435_051430 [Parastagonospora nodorum SN15]KAH3935724.1 hypothetical protein HBH54_038080 [Parastagonospora nodorum]KAH3948534.1 hypothetical protein HBH53_101090 [Parastagonospora nodorum]KAH3988662.1 hypothetical protein HBH52_026780 [Parastagonospora nodorum]
MYHACILCLNTQEAHGKMLRLRGFGDNGRLSQECHPARGAIMTSRRGESNGHPGIGHDDFEFLHGRTCH